MKEAIQPVRRSPVNVATQTAKAPANAPIRILTTALLTAISRTNSTGTTYTGLMLEKQL